MCWGTERQGRISTDSGAWAYHLSDRGQAVEVTTVGQLLSECGVDHIDLFKCDIEGAELEVLQIPSPGCSAFPMPWSSGTAPAATCLAVSQAGQSRSASAIQAETDTRSSPPEAPRNSRDARR